MSLNKKNKIVFAINDFTVAGAQRLYLDLFNQFEKEPFELHLVTLFQFEDKNNFYNLISKNVKVTKLSFKSFFDLKSWFGLIFTLIKIRPNLVVSSLFFSNTIFRILKLLFFYKVVTIEHNTYIHKKKIEILIDRMLSFLTFKIVAVSESVLNFTAKQEGIEKSKFTVIHNGLDFRKIDDEIAKNINPNLKKELGFNDNDKVVINVGRLTYQKNQEPLIKAFSAFVRDHKDYKLIILGEGNLKDKFHQLIVKLGNENQTKLLGSKSNIIPYYLISNYFISPSIIEGFGLAHAEALYCGLPVLTTKTAGPDEFVKEGENGYFMDKSEEGILTGLDKMDKADLTKMRLKTKDSIKDFSIENTASLYKQLIKDCLE